MKIGLPVEPPFPPMEAALTSELPTGEGWLYEPKWDGFRCLAFRCGTRVEMQSKSCKPLGRYFPEMEAALLSLEDDAFVLDGELVSIVERRPSFETLQMRLHPARSRVERLARTQPATLIAFDVLVSEGDSLVGQPLSQRRQAPARFSSSLGRSERLTVSPVTRDMRTARHWLAASGDGIDGVVAKREDCAYLAGDRSGMQKVKRIRSADCVIGGFRYSGATKSVGSLLLGLYEADILHYVGFASSLRAAQRTELATALARLARRKGIKGFTGRSPGASRWTQGEESEWIPVVPGLVVEVRYNQLSGTRFRHGTQFLRQRPDKSPQQCTFEQFASGHRVRDLPAMLPLVSRAR